MATTITAESVKTLMIKIALDQKHTGTGKEHLMNLATTMQALGADSLQDKFLVIEHFNKNASQYSQNIERWKNPAATKAVEVNTDAYSQYTV